jgi:excisionase family DNA binding protein
LHLSLGSHYDVEKNMGSSKLGDHGLIPLSEAAAYGGFTAEYVRQLAKSGKLRADKIGRNWMTTKKAVDDYKRTKPKRGRKSKQGVD